MPEGCAQGDNSASDVVESLSAPESLGVAGEKNPSEWAPLVGPVSWLVLLGMVLVMRGLNLHWWIHNGRLRALLHFGALAIGGLDGLRWGARNEHSRTIWPPRDAHLYWCGFDLAGQLAFGWWQFLPHVPLLAVCVTWTLGLALVGALRPEDMRGTVAAADLCWLLVLARLVGVILGRAILRPIPQAVTDQGVYLSPRHFLPWVRLSHAVIDRDGKVIFLYALRRVWLPLLLIPCRRREEVDSLEHLLAKHVGFQSVSEERLANRLKRVTFLAGLTVLCGGLAVGLVALLVMPGVIYLMLGHNKVLLLLTGMTYTLPEGIFLLALLLSEVISMGLAWLRGTRGVTQKESVEGT